MASDGGFDSFADYVTACQAASMGDVTDGYCLPRITGHDFTAAPLAGYCSVEAAPDCNHFLSADTCRYATFSALSGAATAQPVKDYPDPTLFYLTLFLSGVSPELHYYFFEQVYTPH